MTELHRFLLPSRPFVGGTDTRQPAVDSGLLWLRPSSMYSKSPAHAANDHMGADQNCGHPDKQITQSGFCPANNTGRGTSSECPGTHPHLGLRMTTFANGQK